ncbi:MAG: nucleotidyl transferase AbiEii/AbiGii toxin family protein, partial [Microgenomates group bacterium]
MKSYHLNVLDKNQKKIFPNLSFLAQDGFYLAGGTALALQIGHRTSVDFDFYSNKHFDALTLYDKIEDIFGQKAKRTGQAEDTLFCKIGKADLSFFWYKHPLIKKTITFKGVPLASLGDIAAMKLIAVSRRPVKRDYIDIFFLLKRFSLEQIFSFAAEKYPNINLYFSLRA